ncbi:hypothetical protein QZM35_07330 [Burkholderia sp. AU45274]|uniref:hypothetical protein n=1 Tax=Burkholderia sp. AU45274 TaxID=3059205 RepID=UPI00265519B6|nr:hypothetical protein [Burkholderia sp. AU45274]MDN7487510.1 hypothetical protein [Burkholderia sp. AU45274]
MTVVPAVALVRLTRTLSFLSDGCSQVAATRHALGNGQRGGFLSAFHEKNRGGRKRLRCCVAA